MTSFPTWTLRTVAVTEHQWITVAATVIEDDSVDAVADGRTTNLQTIYRNLTQRPPGLTLGQGATWHDPYPEMRVEVHDTLVRQDLETGVSLEERALTTYTLPYDAMIKES